MAAYDDPRRASGGDDDADDDALLRPTLRPGLDATRYAPLFNPTSLVYAAFFGGLAAGAALFAANFRRMRRPRLAAITLTLGVALTAGYVAYVTWGVRRGTIEGVDDSNVRTLRTGFQIVSAGVALLLARFQKADFNAYLAGGGKPRKALVPSLLATLLGLAFILATFVAAYAAVPPREMKVEIRAYGTATGTTSTQIRKTYK
jgi:4-amino-4-deoxy-L-arabinose transferase-like glycosyltransferase